MLMPVSVFLVLVLLDFFEAVRFEVGLEIVLLLLLFLVALMLHLDEGT